MDIRSIAIYFILLLFSPGLRIRIRTRIQPDPGVFAGSGSRIWKTQDPDPDPDFLTDLDPDPDFLQDLDPDPNPDFKRPLSCSKIIAPKSWLSDNTSKIIEFFLGRMRIRAILLNPDPYFTKSLDPDPDPDQDFFSSSDPDPNFENCLDPDPDLAKSTRIRNPAIYLNFIILLGAAKAFRGEGIFEEKK